MQKCYKIQNIFLTSAGFFLVIFSLFTSSYVFADEASVCSSAGGTYVSGALTGANARKTCPAYCQAEKGTDRLSSVSGTNCCCKASGGSSGSRAVTPGMATPVTSGPFAHIGEATFENPITTGADVRLIAGEIIKKVLGIIGSIALVIFLYGGIQWMIAFGEESKMKKAKDTMVWAGLGLVIIFGSYVLVQMLLKAILGS